MNRMGKYMALEDMQDPANLGAVVRTAEALGVDGLLLSDGCCDVTNPKVLRGSMGGVFRLPLYPAGNMADAVASLQKEGMTAWACVVSPEATPVHRAALGPGSICVIGNEGGGLRPGDRRGLPRTADHCHAGPGGIPERLYGGGDHSMGADPSRRLGGREKAAGARRQEGCISR